MSIEDEIRARVEDTVAPLRNEITQLRSELARAHESNDADASRAHDALHATVIAELRSRIDALDSAVKAAEARAESAIKAADEFRRQAEETEEPEETEEEIEEALPPTIIEAPIIPPEDVLPPLPDESRRKRGFFSL